MAQPRPPHALPLPKSVMHTSCEMRELAYHNPCTPLPIFVRLRHYHIRFPPLPERKTCPPNTLAPCPLGGAFLWRPPVP